LRRVADEARAAAVEQREIIAEMRATLSRYAALRSDA
jgi:hypothetical protein